MPGRKKKGDDEGGAPGWIVTFSDLMSLLLTFFVLLLSFSTISEEDFNDAMMSVQGALGVFDRFRSIVAPMPRPPKQEIRSEVSEAARRLRRRLQVTGLENKVKVEFDAMGGIKISLPNSVLFDTGSATLRPQAYSVLQDIAEVLGELPDTFIEVRGHTDSTPVPPTTPYENNYTLSHHRAYAVAERLNRSGVEMEQFEIVACGPNQPVALNDTEAGRRANRRVELYVRGLVDQDKIEALEPGPDAFGETRPTRLLPLSPQELDEVR